MRDMKEALSPRKQIGPSLGLWCIICMYVCTVRMYFRVYIMYVCTVCC